jgi:hypothetical protein
VSKEGLQQAAASLKARTAVFDFQKRVNLHPTKKESKQSEGSLFKRDSDQFSEVKRSLPNWYVDWKVTCISPPWRYCLRNWKEIL